MWEPRLKEGMLARVAEDLEGIVWTNDSSPWAKWNQEEVEARVEVPVGTIMVIIALPYGTRGSVLTFSRFGKLWVFGERLGGNL